MTTTVTQNLRLPTSGHGICIHVQCLFSPRVIAPSLGGTGAFTGKIQKQSKRLHLNEINELKLH